MFGFLNVNKPKGMTSHDVVAVLRKITGIKQIGHTGTLDPFAVGVLPVCIGKATRLIEYLNDDKEYIASVQFGKNTDTYDLDGSVTGSFDKKITRSELESILPEFTGEILQKPPIYSAVKVNGRKLYDYARKGETAEIKERKVNISKLDLIDFDKENQTAGLCIACSKGTYIRSVAYDIGAALNCGAYLSALTRTKAGAFTIDNTVSLDDLPEASDVEKYLVNPLDVLEYPKITLSEEEKERVSHGMSIPAPENLKNLHVVILVYSGKIYAAGVKEQNKINVKKVLG